MESMALEEQLRASYFLARQLRGWDKADRDAFAERWNGQQGDAKRSLLQELTDDPGLQFRVAPDGRGDVWANVVQRLFVDVHRRIGVAVELNDVVIVAQIIASGVNTFVTRDSALCQQLALLAEDASFRSVVRSIDRALRVPTVSTEL